MKRIYFGRKYEWVNEEHERNRTRAFALFDQGQITLGKRPLKVTREHIDLWLEKNLIIEEVQ